MKINGIEYTLTKREKNLIETALNDCINVKIIPNEGFEGLIASHNWNNMDYIFASIHFNTKNGMWDLYEIDGSFDNERKKCSCSSNFVAINNLKKKKPAKIIVAVGVAPKETADVLRTMVDEVVIANEDPYYQGAVGAYFEDFSQTEFARSKPA